MARPAAWATEGSIDGSQSQRRHHPEDTDLVGTGQERGRDTGKLTPDRTDSGVQRGRDGFKGRAGEGNARPGNE